MKVILLNDTGRLLEDISINVNNINIKYVYMLDDEHIVIFSKLRFFLINLTTKKLIYQNKIEHWQYICNTNSINKFLIGREQFVYYKKNDDERQPADWEKKKM